MRHEVLLSEAMNGRHVRRTQPPAFGSFRSGNRGIWIAALALPIAVIVPIIWYVYFPSGPPAHDIETVIKTYYGFDPLTPPSRLRGPGAIYAVDGRLVRKVCEASPEVLGGSIDESITVNRRHDDETAGRFSLSGNFVQRLNGKLTGARVTTVEYSMKDVIIREIPEAALGRIERLLMSEQDCEDAVSALLTAKKMVCSGYSSLTASISYKVRFDRTTDVSAEAKAVLADVIKETIEENSGGKVSVRNADEFSGENLIYGILLSSRCILLDVPAGRTSGAISPSQPAARPRT
ncbi:MAG: hypothetical protein AB7S93_25660 [Xanthobacteraceae bacterium]